jgi:hypothetical protein
MRGVGENSPVGKQQAIRKRMDARWAKMIDDHCVVGLGLRLAGKQKKNRG